MQLFQRVKLRELYHLEPELFIKENIGIELALNSLDLDSLEQEPDSIPISRIFENKNLKMHFIHAPFQDLNLSSEDSFIRNYALKRLCSALDFCQENHVKKMIFHTGINPLLPSSKKEACYERFANSLKFLTRHARRCRVELLVENTYEPDCFYFEKMLSDFPDLRMVLDLGHSLCFSHDEPESYLVKFQEKITHYHLHDNNGKEDLHLNLGEGRVSFKSLASQMKSNLTATLETPLSSLSENIKRFKSLFS